MYDIVHPPFYSKSFTMFFFIVTINAPWEKKSHELPEKLPCYAVFYDRQEHNNGTIQVKWS